MELTECAACHSTKIVNKYGTLMWLIGWDYIIKDGIRHYHDPNRRHEDLVCQDCGKMTIHTWFIPCKLCGWIAGPEKVRIMAKKGENWFYE